MYILYIYYIYYIYILYIYIYIFGTLNIYIDFKSAPFFIWFMKYSVVAKSSDIKNNRLKVPAAEVKQQSLRELENIT